MGPREIPHLKDSLSLFMVQYSKDKYKCKKKKKKKMHEMTLNCIERNGTRAHSKDERIALSQLDLSSLLMQDKDSSA
jgi:hypothetical protein